MPATKTRSRRSQQLVEVQALIVWRLSTIRQIVRDQLSFDEVTQRECARRAGIHEVTLSKFMTGRTKSPHWRTVTGILKAIGYKVGIWRQS